MHGRKHRSYQYFFVGRERSHRAVIDVRIGATMQGRLCSDHTRCSFTMEQLLFVKKLPLSVTVSDLTSLFSMAGTVRWTRVLTLSSDERFSCGIIEMQSPEAAAAAVALLDLRWHFGVRLSIETLFSPAALSPDDHSVCSGRA